MKLNIYILSSIILLASSCGKWLDVVPKDTVVETELFKEATGYRNALNGVYKQISQPSMYGKEMTWGFMDVMAYYYSTGYNGIGSTKSYYQAFYKYNYEDNGVKSYLKGMWEKTFNSIANCNNIIGKISSESPAKFPEGESEICLIKGEALALRALLHFDMLRIFAPSTMNDDGKSYIPYYEKYPSHGEPKITNQDAKNRIIRDLVEARDLVAKFDTLIPEHKVWMGNEFRFESKIGNSAQAKDIFFAYRGYRMSYPAATAILARVYSYFGMNEEAKIEAEKIINMLNNKYPMFNFTEKSEITSNADVLLTDDLIFTLSFPKLHEDFKFYTDEINGEVLSLRDQSTLFDDNADYRKFTIEALDGKVYFSLKTLGKAGNDYDIVSDMRPMVRLGEMHYIIAEYYASKGDFISATAELDKVRIGRGCKKDQLAISDMTSFVNELIKEAKREFISEGQLFYYYKKYNRMISSKMKPEHFIFPTPDSQNVNF